MFCRILYYARAFLCWGLLPCCFDVQLKPLIAYALYKMQRVSLEYQRRVRQELAKR